MGRVAAGLSGSALLLSAGAWWFSPGAGLVVAGLCGCVLSVLFLVDIGGDE